MNREQTMNPKLFLATVLATACYIPFIAFSAETTKKNKAEKSTFTSSAEFGFLYKTGNTKSGDIKTGVNVKYEKEKWLSLLDLNLLIKKTEQEYGDGKTHLKTTQQKWSFTSQTNYTFNSVSKNYIYGNASYENSRFGNFDSQSSVSTGWGRNWYKTDKASFFADVGPGFKSDVKKVTDSIDQERENSLIIQAQALYLRKINEHVEFKQNFIAKYAPKNGENSKYKAETSITTKLIKTLQLKFTFTVDHNTQVEPGKEKTDTQTAMTLVYSF